MQAFTSKLLKKDVFGQVLLIHGDSGSVVLRDTASARRWAAMAARWMLRREARALAQLAELGGVPELLGVGPDELRRSYIEGDVMHLARPVSAEYFKTAARLVRRMHRACVAHNDLAKEANWLVTPSGSPALLDFQLATYSPRRSRWFRMLAREDLRHLLKHKRTYCPQDLTSRERTILDNPAPLSRLWMASGKKLYLFVTRRIFKWSDREGAGDRQ